MPSEDGGLTYTWNGYVEKGSVYSLLLYVDTHDERLRQKYISWIHDIGERQIVGKRLINHLSIENGLSFWWMSLLVEKSPFKSKISHAVRLLALEEVVEQHRPIKFRLVSANLDLYKTLHDFCENLGIAFEWERLTNKSLSQFNARNIFHALPHSLQALIALVRHIFRRWSLRKVGKTGWFGGARSLFFCSYFIHLEEESFSNGTFYSHHWEVLPKLIHDRGYKTNWLQHYLQSSVVPNTKVALDWAQCSKEQREDEFHIFLDSYLTWHIIARVLQRWLRLNFISWRLRKVKYLFIPEGSQISLWPLMRRDWLTSIKGSYAISSLLWIELFDKAMRDLPQQKKGLYLLENQGWERAFIHAWRKHGHGQLIGVAHSTVRFWDLRYFTDTRTLRATNPYPMPQPDLMALNSKSAIDAYLGLDYPEEALVECEALRYGYINDLRACGYTNKTNDGSIKVLVLGDSFPSATIKTLRLLEDAIPHLCPQVTFTLKQHPNYSVTSSDYPSLRINIVSTSLGEIMRDFDVVFSSSATSAAVDAYLVGLPVVVMLDDTELNFSPLRGQLGVRFVSKPDELANALENLSGYTLPEFDYRDFVFLDTKLPRWNRLLELDEVSSL